MTEPTEPQDAASNPGNVGPAVRSGPSDAADAASRTPTSARTEDLTGDALLDARLAEPVLRGFHGIEAAQVWMSAFLIVVVGLLAYSNGVGGDFIGADRSEIVENEALHHLARVSEASVPGGSGPVATLALSLNWMVTPNSATGFTVVGVMLHLLNGVLLYLVARALIHGKAKEAISMAAGLLFVVLPLATQGVHYAVARGSVLATLFALLGLVTAQRAFRNPASPSHGLMGTCVVWHVLAAGSDPAAIVLPVITGGYLWLVHGSRGWRVWLPWVAGLLALMVAMAIVYTSGVDRLPGRLIAAPSFMVTAVVEMLFPYRLALGHGLPFFSYVITFAVIFFAGCFIAALVILRRRLGFPLLWFLMLSLAVAVTTPPGDLLASYHFYLPVAGLVFLVPWVLIRLPGKARVAAGIVIAFLILASGLGTLQRNHVWQDPVALWEEAASAYPEAFEPKHELGRLYMMHGNALDLAANQQALEDPAGPQLRQEAVQWYQDGSRMLADAVALGDPHTEVRLYLAQAHRRLGDDDSAVAAYLDALAQDSTSYEASLQMATLLESRAAEAGDRTAAARAIAYYERANRMKSMPADRLARYGMLLASMGRYEDAAAVLAEAVGAQEVSPYAGALQNVQGTVDQLRQLEVRSLELLRENPRNSEALRTRAQAMLIRGQYLQAAYVLERLLHENAANYGAWLFLGLARAKMDSAESFVGEHGAPAAPTAEVSAWRDLAARAAGADAWEGARIYLQQEAGVSEFDAMIQLADWALEQGKAAKWASFIARAKELEPDDAAPWLRAADAAIREGDRGAAEAALAEATARGAEPGAIEALREELK